MLDTVSHMQGLYCAPAWQSLLSSRPFLVLPSADVHMRTAVDLSGLICTCMIAEGSPELVSNNAEAHRALMHLHPCKLMKVVEQGQRASPVTAAEPTSHSDPAAISAGSGQPTSGRLDSASSQQVQSERQGHCSLRQPPADPSTYGDIRREQVC